MVAGDRDCATTSSPADAASASGGDVTSKEQCQGYTVDVKSNASVIMPLLEGTILVRLCTQQTFLPPKVERLAPDVSRSIPLGVFQVLAEATILPHRCVKVCRRETLLNISSNQVIN
ncbi:hypothetical protein KIN20_034052 [Parelaphostrongylus tenuis]|uniref:Uncharacterized protein n=1 Tax=Parelaphostrongylus tenuis TaxID=148309 RepID=A0AAD5R8W8_PARTN|nr:hypothetical protein KIN20_034052 [Parelaphostrongylus tenuis]